MLCAALGHARAAAKKERRLAHARQRLHLQHSSQLAVAACCCLGAACVACELWSEAIDAYSQLSGRAATAQVPITTMPLQCRQDVRKSQT